MRKTANKQVQPRCKVCGRTPDQINEYVSRAITDKKYYKDAADVVINDEGTYNPISGLFLCTDCYVKVGMPLGMA